MNALTPDGVFCLSKDCLPSSDWLTHMPSGAAGWAAGGVIIAMSCIRFSRPNSNDKVSILIQRFFFLVVSLFLRAAMSLEAGNKNKMYKFSLFFNYTTAIYVSAKLMKPLFRYDYMGICGFRTWTFETRVSIAPIHNILYILMIPAVVVMFNTVNYNGVDPSVYIIRTVVFCLIIMALVTIIFEMVFVYRESYTPKYGITVSILQNMLLIMWASFMAYRTFMPLDNPARDSESMFYLLNIAPLFVIGVIPRYTPIRLSVFELPEDV